MRFRLSYPRIATMLFLLSAFGAAAQTKSVGSTMIAPAVNPSDSVASTEGGLLVSVLDEKRAHLDRQAVVKACVKDTKNVVWQTTDRTYKAALHGLRAGVCQVEVSAVGYLTSNSEVKIANDHTLYQVHVESARDPSAIDLSAASEAQLPRRRAKK